VRILSCYSSLKSSVIGEGSSIGMLPQCLLIPSSRAGCEMSSLVGLCCWEASEPFARWQSDGLSWVLGSEVIPASEDMLLDDLCLLGETWKRKGLSCNEKT